MAATRLPEATPKQIDEKVQDAQLLMEYAIETGFKSDDGSGVPEDVIAAIETAATKLGSGQAVGALSASERVSFELAYYRLASLMRPVTAETLRDTKRTSKDTSLMPPPGLRFRERVHRLVENVLGYSPAQRFARALLLLAMAFAFLVIFFEWRLVLTAATGDQGAVKYWRSLIELLIPWLYGGLGSCVFLLKSAHVFIHQRTFDVRRKPEYFNRILLGTIAGGAIMLFVNQITADDDSVVRLSSAALGFLAGYSTEFLFSTIERVIAAILPKVGISSVATQRPAAPSVPPELPELAKLYAKAKTDEERAFYKSLLDEMVKHRKP